MSIEGLLYLVAALLAFGVGMPILFSASAAFLSVCFATAIYQNSSVAQSSPFVRYGSRGI